jgi:hypothetical protein
VLEQRCIIKYFFFSFIALLFIIYNNKYTNYKINELNNKYMYLLYISFISIQLFYNFKNISISTSVASNWNLKWDWLPKKENKLFVIFWSLYFSFLLFSFIYIINYLCKI